MQDQEPCISNTLRRDCNTAAATLHALININVERQDVVLHKNRPTSCSFT